MQCRCGHEKSQHLHERITCSIDGCFCRRFIPGQRLGDPEATTPSVEGIEYVAPVIVLPVIDPFDAIPAPVTAEEIVAAQSGFTAFEGGASGGAGASGDFAHDAPADVAAADVTADAPVDVPVESSSADVPDTIATDAPDSNTSGV